MHMHMHTCTHAHIHTRTYTHTHMHTYPCTHAHMHIIHTCVHTCSLTYMHTYIYTNHKTHLGNKGNHSLWATENVSSSRPTWNYWTETGSNEAAHDEQECQKTFLFAFAAPRQYFRCHTIEKTIICPEDTRDTRSTRACAILTCHRVRSLFVTSVIKFDIIIRCHWASEFHRPIIFAKYCRTN